MAEFWTRFAQQFIGGGTRTDVLRPLVWLIGLLVTALVWAGVRGAPMFILVLLSVFLALFLLLYGGAYVLFGMKDPNLLRSERYNIERLAIEHGLYGDSDTGLIRLPEGGKPVRAIEAPAKPETGRD